MRRSRDVSDLFTSGRIVDLIVALTVVEGLVLAAHHRRTGRGIAPLDLIGNLLAGGFLLLALRAALTGASWSWIGAALAAALVAHLTDLARRWRKHALPPDIHR
jgi:hypothetical protein